MKGQDRVCTIELMSYLYASFIGDKLLLCSLKKKTLSLAYVFMLRAAAKVDSDNRHSSEKFSEFLTSIFIDKLSLIYQRKIQNLIKHYFLPL